MNFQNTDNDVSLSLPETVGVKHIASLMEVLSQVRTSSGNVELDHPELQEKTHAAAIRTALKPKVGCNRDIGPFGESVNEGVGLTTTVRIAKATGGDVHIVSGDTLFLDGGGCNSQAPRPSSGIALRRLIV